MQREKYTMAELGFKLGTSGFSVLWCKTFCRGRETRDLQSTALPFVLLASLTYGGLQRYLYSALYVRYSTCNHKELILLAHQSNILTPSHWPCRSNGTSRDLNLEPMTLPLIVQWLVWRDLYLRLLNYVYTSDIRGFP